MLSPLPDTESTVTDSSQAFPTGRTTLRAGVVMATLALLVACSAGGSLTQQASTDDEPSSSHVKAGAGEIDSAFGSYLAGRLARHERDAASAARYLTRALAADPDNLNLMRQTYLALHAEGRMTDAARLARRIVEARPKESIAAVTLAVDAIRKGQIESAKARLDAIPRQGYNTLLVPLLTAWTLAGQSRFDDAQAALDSLDKSQAFAVFRQFHSALISDLADNHDAAEEAYRSTIAAQPGGSFRAVTAFGAFYERGGRSEAARKLYEDYQNENPESVWFEPALARLASGTAAERIVNDAREGSAEALFGIASALFQENALDTALLYARLAIHLRPAFDATYMLLGEILETQSLPEVAIAAYEAIGPSSPLNWSAQLRIATNLDDLDRTDDGVLILRAMAERRPERADVLITLGDMLRARERWDEAVAAYDDALGRVGAFEPRHWRPLYARGIALERSKQWPRAESDFLTALDLEPDQPFVLNYLGYSWVDKGVNLDRALEMIERAVDLRPDDGYITDSLGWAHYRLGNFTDAVRLLERAVVLRPDDPTINDHLGDAYWRVNRRVEARFQWRRALALGPEEDEDIFRIEEKLRRGLLPGTVADGGS